MVTFSNIVHTTSSLSTSIAYPRYVEFEVLTDVNIADLQNGHRLAVKPAQWVNPTYLPETAATLPTQAYWDIITDSLTLTGVDYDMNWVSGSNANNQRNGKLKVRFDDAGGFIQLTFMWWWINIYDTLQYLNTGLDNKNKLLKDATTNPVLLDNSQVDVYSSTRNYRLGLWWIEPTTFDKSFIRLEANDECRFYGDYPGIFENSTFYNNNCSL